MIYQIRRLILNHMLFSLLYNQPSAPSVCRQNYSDNGHKMKYTYTLRDFYYIFAICIQSDFCFWRYRKYTYRQKIMMLLYKNAWVNERYYRWNCNRKVVVHIDCTRIYLICHAWRNISPAPNNDNIITPKLLVIGIDWPYKCICICYKEPISIHLINQTGVCTWALISRKKN